MRKYLVILVLVLVLIFILLPDGQHSNNDNSFKLVNVTLFDGVNWHENTEITVINGYIVTDQSQQASVKLIDGNGGFVIPGLIDAHTHSWGNTLRTAVKFGVTAHLDMFSSEKFLRANSRQRAYAYPQASLFSSGHLITSKGGHGDQFPIKINTLNHPSQAEEALNSRILAGSDYIKIVYDAKPKFGFYGTTFTSIDKATMTAVVSAAKARGVLAVAHVDNELSAIHAIEAGIDGLVHSFADTQISETTIDALVEHKVFVVATLSVMASISNQQRGDKLIRFSPLANQLSESAKTQLRKQYNSTTLPKGYWQHAMTNVKAMIEAGVPVLAGTDVGNAGVVSGLSLHDELSLLCDAGLTPTQAIAAATSLPASAFNLPQRGFLRPDYRADMILLKQDPRDSITATQTIQKIWLKGIALENDS